MIIESGHYDAIQLPDGTLRKHPRSIAFANMDESEFQQLYKAALDVLWRWVLSRWHLRISVKRKTPHRS